jgi:hypothetical protein
MLKMESKTRVAYGYLKETGKLVVRMDTLKEALNANMMVRDYEKEFIKANPQLKVNIVVEKF